MRLSTVMPAGAAKTREKEVNRAVGATTLVITHNAAIRDIADRVIRFADGRIIEETVNATKKQPSEVAW